MAAETRRGPTRRLLAALLSIPLRFKITIPYLFVAILLAGLATWLVSQGFADSIRRQFNSRLVDDSQRVAEAVFDAESAHLSAVRALARTAGVPENVALARPEMLADLVQPYAVNSRLQLVDILDSQARGLYSLHRSPDESGKYATDEFGPYAEWAPVRQVLAGESDDLGDKYSAILSTPWGEALYTVGPIKDGQAVIGAVMVGSRLEAIIAGLHAEALTDLTVYGPDGSVIGSSLGDADQVPPLAEDTVALVSQLAGQQLATRPVRVGTRTYVEALRALFLRGEPSGLAVGVALPEALVAENRGASPGQLALLFSIGVLALIGLGVVVAQLIAIPVFELVRASTQVAGGRLDVEVGVRSADELGVLARTFNKMVTDLRQREFIKELFGRVVSEEVREALLQGDVGLGGEIKTVTVLFTDIRDYTTLSERLPPSEVVALLNTYFRAVNGTVSQQGGFINKFGGDSTLAVFGAPVSLPVEETAHRALQAALGIRAELALLNAGRVEAGQSPIRVGIGINTGEVVTGNVGSEERFEYTVIGDTVNVAARVQSLTRDLPDSNILITETTAQALSGDRHLHLQDLGEITFKGKTVGVRVFAVLGRRPPARQRDWLGAAERPRQDVLEAVFMYARGISIDSIAVIKGIAPREVARWIRRAHRSPEAAARELLEATPIASAELWWLSAEAEKGARQAAGGSRLARAPSGAPLPRRARLARPPSSRAATLVPVRLPPAAQMSAPAPPLRRLDGGAG